MSDEQPRKKERETYLACGDDNCGMPLDSWWNYCPACGAGFPGGAQAHVESGRVRMKWCNQGESTG